MLTGENEQLKSDKAALEATNQEQDARIKELEAQLADKIQQVLSFDLIFLLVFIDFRAA